MSIVEDILAERDEGNVRCGLSGAPVADLGGLARTFDLFDDPSLFHEINLSQAELLLRHLLVQCLAYNYRIMTPDRATELAIQFFSQFSKPLAIFTNSFFDELFPQQVPWINVHSWNPATAATFDAGVLVIGANHSGCFWVDEED